MVDDFFTRALLAGIGVALAAGPLGAFMVWRRMAYFGDATSHASLLGVTLALATGMSTVAGVAAAALAMALVVSLAAGRTYAMDTLLGVAAHGALACGLVAMSLLPGFRLDPMMYLFGDILTVGTGDLAVIWAGALAVTVLLAWRWTGLLLTTLNEDLAAAAGVDADRERLALSLALALLVAVALQVVGALLITAMLIVPAAAARTFARTPEAMAGVASAIGVVAVILGLTASLYIDTPAGPSIVVAAMAILLAANLARALVARNP